MLGGNIRVQGVYDDQYIQIESGTSSHHKICLKNKGLKRVNSYGTGDHYVHIKIDVPKTLTSEQKTVLQAYAEIESDTPGQIFGVTMKKDGKRNFENVNFSTEKVDSKFTQGAKETDAENANYQEHDKTGTHEYRKEQMDGKVWYGLGFLLLFGLGIYLIEYSQTKQIEIERNRVLDEQRRIHDDEINIHNASSPFRNA